MRSISWVAFFVSVVTLDAESDAVESREPHLIVTVSSCSRDVACCYNSYGRTSLFLTKNNQ